MQSVYLYVILKLTDIAHLVHTLQNKEFWVQNLSVSALSSHKIV